MQGTKPTRKKSMKPEVKILSVQQKRNLRSLGLDVNYLIRHKKKGLAEGLPTCPIISCLHQFGIKWGCIKVQRGSVEDWPRNSKGGLYHMYRRSSFFSLIVVRRVFVASTLHVEWSCAAIPFLWAMCLLVIGSDDPPMGPLMLEACAQGFRHSHLVLFCFKCCRESF